MKKRNAKKWLVYIFHYPEENIYKVGCTDSVVTLKKRLQYWNRKLEKRGEVYNYFNVKDKYLEERNLIWYLCKTNKVLYKLSIELYFDIKEEVDFYISKNFI